MTALGRRMLRTSASASLTSPTDLGLFERGLGPTRLTAGARKGTLAPLATSAKKSWGRFGHRLAGLRPAEMNTGRAPLRGI